MGTLLLLTIGTGIGSALFINSQLVPNTELGHLQFKGKDAETLVSGAARDRRKLGWKRWGREFSGYLARVELYLSPDLIIFGGGVSKEYAKWASFVRTQAPVVTAEHLNLAGIIGAAYAAAAARPVALRQRPAAKEKPDGNRTRTPRSKRSAAAGPSTRAT